MSTSATTYTRAHTNAVWRVLMAVLGTMLGLTTVAAGIIATALPASAATAPTLSNGSAAYDNVTSEPATATTTTAVIASPGTATSLTVAGTYGPGSASTNGYTFAPIGDVDINSTCGLDIFSYTSRASITSFTGASLVSGNPTCSIPSGSAVTQLGAPTQFNAMSLVSGGAANVNPSSLYIASQPPISDGYAQVTTTSTTGIITMQPESTAVGNFSLTFGYCAPGETYPSGPDCSTATLTYDAGSSTLVGENVSISISSETIYESPASANTSPQYTAKGSNFSFTQDPTTSLIPFENYSSIGTVTINYANGFASIEPVPAGMTFVPGSIQQFGGDGVTGGGATTVKYCTAAGTGCDATMSGNYKTTYPYLEEEFTGVHIAGGAMVTLPGFSAQFTATGNPGAAPQNTLTELRVTTNTQVPILGATNVAFDGYPTSCAYYTANGNTSGCPTSGTPAYVAPTGPPFTTIIPSVTGLDTTTDSTTGGATVNITGTGFSGASAVDFGSAPAQFSVNNDGSITATDPGGSVGTVDVTVVNGGETSATSSADQFTYTLGVPGAPTNAVALPDEAQSEVSWSAPFNPGDPIESYTVTATDTTTPANGGETCTSATTSCTVSGLTDGDTYTFAVTATSDVGTGPSSASSAPIVVGAPQAPTAVSATGAQNTSSTVTWTPPALTGSGPVSSYTVSATDHTTPANGGQTCVYTVSDPEVDACNVTGLTNGDSYTFTVSATNASGTGPSSAPSNAVVPSTVPGAPTAVSGTSNANAQSVVSFTAPASNGGAAITGYTVTATDTTTPANGGQSASGTTSPITVTGLTNGDSYTFTVAATNVSGTGPASAPSAPVVPATVPGAPTAVTASSTPITQTTAATVSWTAPASNGGSAITSYKATSSTGSKTCTATAPATTCNVTGLTNGTSYTFTVTATNAVGTSAASAPSNAVVPSTTPSAPTIGTATSGNASASVAFTNLSGTNTGGLTISSYTVTATDHTTPANGGQTASGAGTPIVVSGLTNGDSYTFTVYATNADGNGPNSAASAAVTIGIPGAPTAVVANPGNAAATVSWTAPANVGGGPITSYTVKPNSGSATCTATAPATSCTVSGLTNKTAYTFTVTATNAYGTGPASSASASITVGAPTQPTNVVATGAQNASSTVSWTVSDNGSAITSQTVTSSTGSKTCSPSPATATSCTVTGLTNGTAYTFTVKSVNANGTSPTSAASNSITPSTVPGAPTAAHATAGVSSAAVSFTAPSSNGGAAISSYTVTATDTTTPANGGQSASGASSPITVSGLTNGDSYTFTVTATNVSGTGTASAASNAVVPSTVPDAPTAVTATPGDQSAAVSWTPGFNEGSTTTSYTVTASDSTTPANGGETCTYTVSNPETDACTVSGLTDGDSYTFTVTATNANGTGPASAPSNAVTPASPPGAPTGVTASAANASASVSWTPPADNGGSAVTSYTVTASDSTTPANGGETCTYTVSDPETDTCTVTGLANGDSYTFIVTATNTAGTGPASDPSNAVTPSTVPDAPTGATATAGNESASVSFTPGFDEGSAITGYTVTATDTTTPANGGQTASGASSPITVSGLTNGDSYTFTVTATNANGTGAASDPSNAVTPAAVPDAPTNATASAGDQSATVTWTPGGDEGSAISSYTVTASDSTTPANGGQTCTYTVSDPETDSCTVSGLTNGDSYTFSVTATNANGTGAASAASNAVTPSTVPDAPTNATATPGNGSASVSFTPGFNEGAPITSYTVTATDSTTPANGGQTASGSGSPISVSGLTNGDSYTFTVTATNANGTGAASAPSNAVTPSTVPDAPTGATATAGNASASVSFTPGGDEGSAITSYTVTATDHTHGANGGQTASGSGSPITVSGLTNGDSYTFTVKATNGDGTGAASAASNAVTPSTVPDAPTNATATPGNHLAVVTFTPGSDEGSAITGYTVTATDNTTPANGGQTATSTSSPISVNGLTNGDSYTFTVTATNADGTGAASAPSNAVVPGAAPTVTSFSPTSGPVGTVVTIHGTNLENATVTFHGGTVGTLKKDTATTIKVHVPSGAKSGKIVVTTPGGTTQTATKFKVT
jgi:large repetitive protein